MPLQNPPVLAIQHELPLIDAGLRLVLGTMSEFHVLPAESSPRQLETADVMVLDHDAALRRLRTALPGAPNALVVSPIGHDTNVRGALESGVLGFVSAAWSADELRMAVRVVAAGRRYLCGPASLRIADSLASPALIPREHEVLALVSRGRNNKEVARLLEVSVGTVKSHMRALLSKLGAWRPVSSLQNKDWIGVGDRHIVGSLCSLIPAKNFAFLQCSRRAIRRGTAL